jgi:hypothetical protein
MPKSVACHGPGPTRRSRGGAVRAGDLRLVGEYLRMINPRWAVVRLLLERAREIGETCHRGHRHDPRNRGQLTDRDRENAPRNFLTSIAPLYVK